MIGILVEKGSAARNFAKALGGSKGSYNGESYIIVASSGHLLTFNQPKDMVSSELSEYYAKWKLDNLPWNYKDFDWSKRIAPGTKQNMDQRKERLKDIKNTLKDCDEVVIATDDDPTGEGEMIAWEIFDYISLRGKKITRMYFADEQPREIQKAFKNRVKIDSKETDKDYDKADKRSKIDFMTMQWCRALTCIAPDRAKLVTGRVKGYMTVIVGDQILANKNYKEIPFFENRFKDDHDIVYTNKDEEKYPNKEDVPNIYKESEVVLDETQRKHKGPPSLLDMASLAAVLAEKGFGAQKVKNTYQTMYDDQILSYPRTADRTITPDQFAELVPLAPKIAKVIGVDPKLLTHTEPRKTHVKADSGAHGANRPGPNVPTSLAALEEKYGGKIASAIYIILARNFLALLGEDYIYDHQTGHVKDYPQFTGFCNIPVDLGYKRIFDIKDSEENKDVNEKGLGSVASPFVYEGLPPKPQWPTMRWLMKDLDKNDIGTGATRTSIYAEMISNENEYHLFTDTKGKINLTEYGWEAYYLLKDTHMGSRTFTKEMWDSIRNANGEKGSTERLLAGLAPLLTEDIATIRRNAETLPEEFKKKEKIQYPKKDKYTGVWQGDEVSFNKEWGGHKFTDEECALLCAGKTISIDCVSKEGKKYSCKGYLAEQEMIGDDKKKHKFIGFRRLDEIPEEWCHHRFTQEERDALAEGESIPITAHSDAKGVDFSCEVSWGKGSKGFMQIIPVFEKK